MLTSSPSSSRSLSASWIGPSCQQIVPEQNLNLKQLGCAENGSKMSERKENVESSQVKCKV